MLRRRHLSLCTTIALLTLAAGCHHTTDHADDSALNQPGGAPAAAEDYALYSSLYRVTTDEPLAFAESSQTDLPQVDGMCLKPGNDEERQLAAAFETANKQSHTWTSSFQIAQGYRVLSREESDAARRCIRQHGEGRGCDRYKGLRVVRYLGMPAFNRDHTRALVSVIKSCGQGCGSGGLFVAKKTANGWEHEPPSDFVRDCSWSF